PWLGAIVLAVVRWAAAALWRFRRKVVVDGAGRVARTEAWLRIGVLAVIALVLIALPFLVGSIVTQILGTVGIYILMGLGLNIVVGYAGLLDLGYVAFFAGGAYSTAVLTGGVRSTTAGRAPPAFSLYHSLLS